MQLQLQCKRYGLSDSIRDQVYRSVYAALGRFDHAIRKVVVRLTDVNGPRGGPDKYCRIDVQLAKGGTVNVDDVGEDLVPVVNRTADRTSHTIAKYLARRRERKARSPKRNWIDQ